jgi:hypothetical protein
MVEWSTFEEREPRVAEIARRLLYRDGDGEGLLATVRGDDAPRIHPVNVGVVDGHLYTFVQARSAKRRDMDEDGRFALHSYVDPERPDELMLRGRARVVEDAAIRSQVAADWFFRVSDSYPLYELLIEHALLGERAKDEWPPRYSSWKASP